MRPTDQETTAPGKLVPKASDGGGDTPFPRPLREGHQTRPAEGQGNQGCQPLCGSQGRKVRQVSRLRGTGLSRAVLGWPWVRRAGAGWGSVCLLRS